MLSAGDLILHLLSYVEDEVLPRFRRFFEATYCRQFDTAFDFIPQ